VLVATVRVRAADPAEARAFLARLEAQDGVPPVDEDEQRRLAGQTPVRDRDWWWGGHLVVVDDVPVAYAGTRLAPDTDDVSSTDCAARVDLAFDRRHPAAQVALRAALDDARAHAVRAGATPACDVRPVDAWLRGATDDDLRTTADAGFRVKARLHVLGASIDTVAADAGRGPHAALAGARGLRLRPFDPEAAADADAVVTLLTSAYPELDGWYGSGFGVLCATDWFRADDLLMLESDEGLLGIHWMKRRGDAVGEVYNLALAPEAQGRGLGGLLLDAGLAHLMDVGSREVILWVDAENPPALALYRSRGFTHRWDDVSLIG
jgi:mycothiol synthase